MTFLIMTSVSTIEIFHKIIEVFIVALVKSPIQEKVPLDLIG